MNKRKVVLRIIYIIALVMSITSCGLFAGILYPKSVFSLYQLGDVPPSPAQERLEQGDKYPQTFEFHFPHGANSFTTYFITTLFVNKKYQVLNLNEMSIEWDDNRKVLVEDEQYVLPIDKYLTNGVWYWGYVQYFYSTNFEKLFKGKKAGDEFLCKLTIKYSFDDEAEQEQILEYRVVVTKGRYIHQFF